MIIREDFKTTLLYKVEQTEVRSFYVIIYKKHNEKYGQRSNSEN